MRIVQLSSLALILVIAAFLAGCGGGGGTTSGGGGGTANGTLLRDGDVFTYIPPAGRTVEQVYAYFSATGAGGYAFAFFVPNSNGQWTLNLTNRDQFVLVESVFGAYGMATYVTFVDNPETVVPLGSQGTVSLALNAGGGSTLPPPPTWPQVGTVAINYDAKLAVYTPPATRTVTQVYAQFTKVGDATPSVQGAFTFNAGSGLWQLDLSSGSTALTPTPNGSYVIRTFVRFSDSLTGDTDIGSLGPIALPL